MYRTGAESHHIGKCNLELQILKVISRQKAGYK